MSKRDRGSTEHPRHEGWKVHAVCRHASSLSHCEGPSQYEPLCGFSWADAFSAQASVGSELRTIARCVEVENADSV